jgi:hypothetical protein
LTVVLADALQADLSSDTKDAIVGGEHEEVGLNLKALSATKECNIPGTQAARDAEINKAALSDWGSKVLPLLIASLF